MRRKSDNSDPGRAVALRDRSDECDPAVWIGHEALWGKGRWEDCRALGPKARVDGAVVVEAYGPLIAMPGGGEILLGQTHALELIYYPSETSKYEFDPLPNNEGSIYLRLPEGGSDPESLMAVETNGKIVLAGQSSKNGERVLVTRLRGISQAVVSLPRQRIRVTSRVVLARLRCSTTQNCDGTVNLAASRHPQIALGRGRFAIQAGKSARVAIALTRYGRTQLTVRRETHATLTLEVQDGPVRTAKILVLGR